MTPQIGLLLALGCAFATNLAFLWKHRGAVAAPDVDIRHPLAQRQGPVPLQVVGDRLRASRSPPGGCTSRRSRLPRSRWCRRSSPAASCSWPCSPTAGSASSSAGGEWMGVALTAVGLAFLGLTVQTGSEGSHSSYSISGMIAFEGAMIVARRAAPALAPGRAASRHRHGVDARRRGRHPLRCLRHLDQGAHRHGPGRPALDRQPLDARRDRSPRSPPSTPPPAAFSSARASR